MRLTPPRRARRRIAGFVMPEEVDGVSSAFGEKSKTNLGCCRATPCGGASRRPCRVLCLLCRVQTLLLSCCALLAACCAGRWLLRSQLPPAFSVGCRVTVKTRKGNGQQKGNRHQRNKKQQQAKHQQHTATRRWPAPSKPLASPPGARRPASSSRPRPRASPPRRPEVR